MIENLVSFLEQHAEFTDEERSYLAHHVPVKRYDKKQMLLVEGELSKEFFFVIEGCVRLFYQVDGEEKTAFFYLENSFVSSYESFTKQEPAKNNLQAIENTIVASISYEVAYDLVQRFPKFEFLARVMMEEELIMYQEIVSSFITLNAEERYLNLIRNKSPIIQRIPQHQLATYLGINPETLSRIRKRISSRDLS